MTISERLFHILKERGMTQVELSRLTGISTKTISAWNKLGTNPGADKIMIICEALEITPETLLAGKDMCIMTDAGKNNSGNVLVEEQLVSDFRELSESKKRRLMAYMNMLQNTKEKTEIG